MKTNKALTKRVRQTRQGKLLARSKRQNHFRAKASKQKKLARRGLVNIQLGDSKMINKNYA